MKSFRKTTVTGLFLLGLLFFPLLDVYPLRSFNQIFPTLGRRLKREAFSSEGLKRSFDKNESRSVIPSRNSGIDLFSIVMEKNPSHFAEALMVVPYDEKELNKLDAYNALGRIGDIKNHSYFNHTRNTDINIFDESTRLESAGKDKPVPDPAPAKILPASESIYLRLRDIYFGTIYVRGDLSAGRYGITYNLTNFKAIRFLIFTLMKPEKFSAVLYIEPLKEGMLIYSMAAVDIPDFVASRVYVSTDVERRLTILISWINEGLRRQMIADALH
ncbi:MAG: hypothetical protein LBH43_12285 [Treponema sp.]|jgi:hypothetical protein|nr:hypothetical protein [Treponema sp.]